MSSLVFNSGLANEVCIGKITRGSCRFISNLAANYRVAWPNDPVIPFDCGPHVRAFVLDNTKKWVKLIKFSSSYNLCLAIQMRQVNDVIHVDLISLLNDSTVDRTWKTDLFTINITSIQNSALVYFMYENKPNGDYSSITFYTGNMIEYQTSQVVSSGTTYLAFERSGEEKPLSDYNVYPSAVMPIPYDDLSVSTDPILMNIVPLKVFSHANLDYAFSTTDTLDLDGMVSVDNTEPVPPEPTDPNDEGDPSDEDGGDGDHDPTYDPIPIPNKPTQGAATAGFVTLYKLAQGQMSQFASDCFASNLWEALKLFFSNPMDFLVGVNLLPFEPTGGASWKPKFGVVSFSHAYPTVANQYVDIDCGSVEVKKYWGSCFDFEPYTKIQIWLPYIGYRDLPADEIMGMTVSVKYRCDCLTGDCVAFVYTGVVGQTGPQVERVIAQFYGNCAVRVPFSSVSYDSAITNSIALIGAAASAGISAGAGVAEAAGKAGGEISGLEAAGRELATNTASVGMVQGMKPNIHKGGAAGASTGYMSIQVPYLIRRIPRQNLPSDYMKLKGYPSNIGGKLADFTGLAIVDDIQLNDIPAMEDERKEILQWLRGGVLI